MLVAAILVQAAQLRFLHLILYLERTGVFDFKAEALRQISCHLQTQAL